MPPPLPRRRELRRPSMLLPIVFVCLLLGGATLGGVLLLRAAFPSEEEPQGVAAGSSTVIPDRTVRAGVGDFVVLGGVKFAVGGATVGPAGRHRCLSVVLGASAADADRITAYPNLAHFAHVRDERGNRYAVNPDATAFSRASLPAPARPDGMVRSGEVTGDVLCFERPVKNHGTLTLVIDRRAFGAPVEVAIPPDKVTWLQD